MKTISITIFGQVKPDKIIYRSQARVGDWLLASGEHGAARAGLECLLHPGKAQEVPAEQQQRWRGAHQRPLPRLDLIPHLQNLGVPIAGMDSSDGLADAVLQICRASGVGAVLEQEKLPIAPGLGEWVGLATAIDWTLYGGEDFELVFTLPGAVAASWLAQLDPGQFPPGRCPRRIGQIVGSSDVFLITEASQSQPILPNHSFQHF